MARYYIPVHFTTSKSARYKAIFDTIAPHHYYPVEREGVGVGIRCKE